MVNILCFAYLCNAASADADVARSLNEIYYLQIAISFYPVHKFAAAAIVKGGKG